MSVRNLYPGYFALVMATAICSTVLTRLLLLEVRSEDLAPPYWIIMGATAITVLAAARMLSLDPAPAITATHAVLSGLAVMLWAFGTWLIPMLVAFGIWRQFSHPGRMSYVPTLWSIVFPLGMYAVASMELGAVAGMPLVEGIGRVWTWVAIAAWVGVFVAMCATALRAGRRQLAAVRRR